MNMEKISKTKKINEVVNVLVDGYNECAITDTFTTLAFNDYIQCGGRGFYGNVYGLIESKLDELYELNTTNDKYIHEKIHQKFLKKIGK